MNTCANCKHWSKEQELALTTPVRECTVAKDQSLDDAHVYTTASYGCDLWQMSEHHAKVKWDELRAFVRKHEPGQCKMLSLGIRCACLLCAIDMLASDKTVRVSSDRADFNNKPNFVGHHMRPNSDFDIG